jgi:uncharacterized protein (DUF779 family)
MKYKEHDVVYFTHNKETLVGKIIYLKEVMGEPFYIVATQYTTYNVSQDAIIEKL